MVCIVGSRFFVWADGTGGFGEAHALLGGACLARASYGLRQDLFRDIELLGHRDMNNRGLRGGAFNNNDNNLQSSNRNNNNPTNENNNIGFRVSSLRKAAPA